MAFAPIVGANSTRELCVYLVCEKQKNPVFQLRSSLAPFDSFSRFERVEKSVSYVFSTNLLIPTPPASTRRRAQRAMANRFVAAPSAKADT
jgi:hypothetical protein